MTRSSYREDEVQALIEGYAELAAKRDTTRTGLRYTILLADLGRAMARLSRKPWEVVLLHGLLGLPQRETAELLSISQRGVGKRYRRALEELHYLMNGGE